MDTTPAALLGQQLSDFFLKQFAPSPESRHILGFLGTGVAVDPDSFLSQGQFNPARINSWLNIVADPLGSIPRDGGWVCSNAFSASSLMQAIADEAMCAAPATSEEANGFAKAKSSLMEFLGGSLEIDTAPLDWYDPSKVSTWPECKLTTGTASSAATVKLLPRNPTGEPQLRRLWAWRTLEKAVVPAGLSLNPAALAGAITRAREGPPPTAPTARPPQALAKMLAPHLGSLQAAAGLSPSAPPASEARAATQDATPARLLIERVPAAFISELAPTRDFAQRALAVSKAISDAADRAGTTAVSSESLALSLKYLVVTLSRTPWWSDFLLLLNNWYIPGLARGAMINEGNEQVVTGVPIALILTADVTIEGNWSESDHAAASASTHFGPWPVQSAQFLTTRTAGTAVLSIPGITAVACIYNPLPPLPPKFAPIVTPHEPCVDTSPVPPSASPSEPGAS